MRLSIVTINYVVAEEMTYGTRGAKVAMRLATELYFLFSFYFLSFPFP